VAAAAAVEAAPKTASGAFDYAAARAEMPNGSGFGLIQSYGGARAAAPRVRARLTRLPCLGWRPREDLRSSICGFQLHRTAHGDLSLMGSSPCHFQGCTAPPLEIFQPGKRVWKSAP
jgi:hypothetical protein